MINQYIEKQNDLIAKKKLPKAHHINLKTLLIGNGWYDPLIQYQAYYNFTVYPGYVYCSYHGPTAIKWSSYSRQKGRKCPPSKGTLSFRSAELSTESD